MQEPDTIAKNKSKKKKKKKKTLYPYHNLKYKMT